MKNKKLIYFLLPLVCLIWGLIFYKFFGALNPEVPVVASVLKKKIKTAGESGHFELIANYPDPFLRKRLSLRKPAEEEKVPVKPIPKPVVVWPKIEYLGMIEKKAKSRVGLLKIGNAEMILKENESGQGILLKRLWKDSVLLVLGGEERIVK